MAGGEKPWFLYHCTRGAHFDNYPHPDFLGRSPAKHPYKDALVELDDICGRLIDTLERTGQVESTLVVISSDNGPATTTALMDTAAQQGVAVQSLSVQSTTLDDVFVHYAGRALRDALQEANPMDRQGFMVRRQ